MGDRTNPGEFSIIDSNGFVEGYTEYNPSLSDNLIYPGPELSLVLHGGRDHTQPLNAIYSSWNDPVPRREEPIYSSTLPVLARVDTGPSSDNWVTPYSAEHAQQYDYNPATEVSRAKPPLNPPPELSTSSTSVTQKRKSEETPDPNTLDWKRPKDELEALWDFGIKTMIKVRMRTQYVYKETIPLYEIKRSKVLRSMRDKYEKLCHDREKIKSPDESFSRWILERRLLESKQCDPIIAFSCNSPEESYRDDRYRSMYQDIIRDIPVPIRVTSFQNHANGPNRPLFQYAHASMIIANERSESHSTDANIILEHCQREMKWIETNICDQSKEECYKRLSQLRQEIYPSILNIVRHSVDSICREMDQEANTQAHDLFKRTGGYLTKTSNVNQNQSPSYPIKPVSVISYQNQTFDEFQLTDKFALYELCITSEHATDPRVQINKVFYKKVEELYKLHNPKFSKDLFHRRLWCMLKRYQVIFGANDFEANVYQAALPVAVYKVLHEQFGVTMECFASPLNCYFKSYCSLCPDTDGFFGSCGDFLSLDAVEGSFQANPPFSFGILLAMVNHFENLLATAEKSKKKLSFIIFVPDCQNPVPLAQLKMEVSSYCREVLLIPAHEHKYRSGLEYINEDEIVGMENEIKQKSLLLTCCHGTYVFFLQSTEAFKKWQPTAEKLEQIKTGFCQ